MDGWQTDGWCVFAFMLYPVVILLLFQCIFQSMFKAEKEYEELRKKETWRSSYRGTGTEEGFFIVLSLFSLLNFTLALLHFFGRF